MDRVRWGVEGDLHAHHNISPLQATGTYPPLARGHISTKEGGSPAEVILLRGTDDPLDHTPVRSCTTTACFEGVVDAAMFLFGTVIDRARDRGGRRA